MRDKEEILRSFRLIDEDFEEEGEITRSLDNNTACFAMNKINVMGYSRILHNENTFSVLLVTEGNGILKWGLKEILSKMGIKSFPR